MDKPDTIHIRKRIVKVGGNQWYKSERYNGPVETICGNPPTTWDLRLSDVTRKSFNTEKHENLIHVSICKECLNSI